MKKLRLMILMTVCVMNLSFGADNYRSGDTLYVWAKNGLNLRSGPGTDYAIRAQLPFGTRLIVSMKTDNRYNAMGIAKTEKNYHTEKLGPLVFNGNWVLVLTEDGPVGYVIDQYLLKFKPEFSDNFFSYGLNLEIAEVDTLFKSSIQYDGSGLNHKVKKCYNHGISLIEKAGGVWGEFEYILPGLTLEESLILFSSALNDYNNFTVLRNWKEEIIFVDNELCMFTLKQKNGKVIFNYGCSC